MASVSAAQVAVVVPAVTARVDTAAASSVTTRRVVLQAASTQSSVASSVAVSVVAVVLHQLRPRKRAAGVQRIPTPELTLELRSRGRTTPRLRRLLLLVSGKKVQRGYNTCTAHHEDA
jgi:hypothetical protein